MHTNNEGNDLMSNLITTIDRLGVNIKDCVVKGDLDANLVIEKLSKYELIDSNNLLHKESTR
ncbi:hypothetical protein ACPJHQ_25845 [Rossellomorea sp. H39__3]